MLMASNIEVTICTQCKQYNHLLYLKWNEPQYIDYIIGIAHTYLKDEGIWSKMLVLAGILNKNLGKKVMVERSSTEKSYK